nr:TPA_asm: hypothetical protein [Phagomor virus 1]
MFLLDCFVRRNLVQICDARNVCPDDIFGGDTVTIRDLVFQFGLLDGYEKGIVVTNLKDLYRNEMEKERLVARQSIVRVTEPEIETNPRADPELAFYFDYVDARKRDFVKPCVGSRNCIEFGDWRIPKRVLKARAPRPAWVDEPEQVMADIEFCSYAREVECDEKTRIYWHPSARARPAKVSCVAKLVCGPEPALIDSRVCSSPQEKRWQLHFIYRPSRWCVRNHAEFVSAIRVPFGTVGQSDVLLTYSGIPAPRIVRSDRLRAAESFYTQGIFDRLRDSLIDSTVSSILAKIMPVAGVAIGNALSTFILSTITIFSDVPVHVKFCQIGIIISNFLTLGCNPNVVSSLKKAFEKFVTHWSGSESTFFTQADGPKHGKFLTAITDALYCVFVNPKAKSTGINVSYLRIFTDAVNALRAAKSLEEMLAPVLIYVRDFFESRLCGGIEPNCFRHLSKELPLWLEKCEEFLRYDRKEGMIQAMNLKFSEYEMCLRTADLINRGNEYYKLLCSMSDVPSAYMAYFNRTLLRISKLGESLNAKMVGMNGKSEPFIIYLHGAAGVGKSVLTDVIAKHLLFFEDDEYDPRQDKFQRSPGSDYWDGYNNQKLYVDDDFLQSKDVKYRTEAITTLILLGSRAPFPLNMAHLDGKGTTFFNSKIVILTSNAEASQNTLEQHIESHQAFKRRLNALVKVTATEPMQLKKDFDLAPLRFTVDGTVGELTFREFIVLLGKRRKASIAKNLMLDTSINSLKMDLDLKELVTQNGLENLTTGTDSGNRRQTETDSLTELKLALDGTESANWTKTELITQNGSDCTCSFNTVADLDTCHTYLTNLVELTNLLTCNRISLEEFFQRTRLGAMCPHLRDDVIFRDVYLFDVDDVDEVRLSFLERRYPPYSDAHCVPKIVNNMLHGYFCPPTDTANLDFDSDDVEKVLNSRDTFDAHFDGEKVTLPSYSSLSEKALMAPNVFTRLFSKIRENPIITALVVGFSSVIAVGGVFAAKKVFTKKDDRTIISAKSLSETTLHNEKKFYPGDNSVTYHGKRKVRMRHEGGDPLVDDTEILLERNDVSLDLTVPVVHTHKCKTCGFKLKHSHFMAKVQHPIDAATFKHVCKSTSTPYEQASELISEGCSDESHRTIMAACSHNVFSCVNLKTRASLSGFFPTGTLALIPSHFFFDSSTGLRNFDVDISISSLDFKNVVVHVSDCTPVLYEDKDIVSFIVPRTLVAMRRNLIRHFVTEEDLQEEYENGSLFRIVPLTRCDLSFETMAVSNIRLNARPVETKTIEDGKTFTTVMAASCSYDAHTANGDCGSLLTLHGSRYLRKLLGFHVAGGQSTCVGLSTVITADWLVSICSTEQQSFKYPKFKGIDQVDSFFLDRVECVGIVPKDLKVRMCSKTKIKESLLYDEIFPHVTLPALLSVKDGLDPLRLGIEKAFAPDWYFDSDVVSLATNSLCASINSMASSYRKTGVLSDLVAINGIAGDEFLCPMNFKTSAGYPYVLLHKPGKDWLFDGECGAYVHKPFVDEVVSSRLECARNGICKAVVFVDTKKDERRPIEKVERGKTRIFSVAPYDFNFLVRKYFLAFICHCMANSVSGEISVGLNVHSRDWGTMFHITRSKGDYWMAGDYSAYDKRLPYQLCMSAMEVVHEFYDDGDENRRIRETLALSMFSGFRIADDVCYRLHHGMPSGVPITAVFNSLVNSLIFRICFVLLAKEHVKDKALLASFIASPTDWFSFRSYGDDHIVRVSKVVSGFFTMVNVSRLLASYGIEYTSTEKHEVACDFVEEKDLSYLKRKFVVRDGSVFAPLEMDSIRELMNWVKVNDLTPKQALEANIDCALLEMTHYRKAMWEEFYRKVRIGAAGAGVRIKTYSFSASLETLRHLPRLEQSDPTDVVLVTQSGNATSEIAQGTGLVNRPIDADNSVLVGLTEFRDADKPVTEVVATIPVIGLFNPFDTPSYIEYLSRPMLLVSSVWGVDQSGCIFVSDFPYELRKFSNFVSRMSAFQMARFGVRFMIRMNGSSLHYGRLAFSVLPYVGSKYVPSAYQNSVSLLNFPSICVSPSDPTTQHLEVPYTNPRPFVPVRKMLNEVYHSEAAFFKFIIHIYTPLSGPPGVAPVSFTVHFQLIDLDLIGFCGVPITAVPYEAPLLFPAKEMQDIMGQNAFFTQASKVSKEANKKSQNGSLSSALASAGSIAGMVSAIPGLGEVAAPIGAIASLGSGIAAALGWDRPLTTKVTEKVYERRPNPNFGVGIDMAEMLCFDPENKVGDMVSAMGGDQRDMEISRIISRPGFIQRLKLASSVGAESRFGLIFVSPLATLVAGKFPLTDSSVVEILETPLSYVARAFTFWRGSIRFHCQVISSVFHSCRIRVVYNPYAADLASAQLLKTDLISQVIDIRGDTDFEFTVPYMQYENYRPVSDDFELSANGVLGFYVVNPLTYPSLPIPDIYVNVWISGAEDLEFYRPTSRYLIPRIEYVTQAGIVEEAAKPIQEGQGVVVKNFCFGERITHLKELLGISMPVDIVVASGSGVTERVYDPAAYQMENLSIGTESFISHFRHLFAFSRGGFSFWFDAVLPVGRVSYEACLVPYDLRVGFPSTFIQPLSFPVAANFTQPSIGSTGSLLICYVPYDDSVPFFSNYALGCTTTRSLIAVDVPPGTALKTRLAVADDFQLGFPVGAPSFKVRYSDRLKPKFVTL